jgi:hypothetical protein
MKKEIAPKTAFGIGIIALFFTICFLSLSFIYINANTPDQYCAKMKDGILTVAYEGNTLTSEVTLNDGSKIEPNGIVIKKDGRQILLQDGECIDSEGKMDTDIPK